ncbi:MAG: hypothetical protein QOH34_3353 [Mycobacterium sp.]|jgi:hypothetical protein|nr:hypothetical protein [Mycobacterium sp.]
MRSAKRSEEEAGNLTKPADGTLRLRSGLGTGNLT